MDLPRIFVIGDSISIQYGPYLERDLAGSWHYDRKRDDAGAPRAISNLDVPTGANGGDSGMVLAYMRRRLENHPISADLLLLNCGLHDIKIDPRTNVRQISSEAYEANLHGILDIASAMALRPVWLTTTPVIDAIHNVRNTTFRRHASDVETYNAIAARVMTLRHVPVVDLHACTLAHLPEGYIDHVHVCESVREAQGAFIAARVRAMRCPAQGKAGSARSASSLAEEPPSVQPGGRARTTATID
jgi:lysophospholipase L1-like esterase